jgi:beta-glucosidase
VLPGQELAVALKVTNTGERGGQEVVQLYVADERARVERPPKELKAFGKLQLDPGESCTVRFTLDMRALAFFDEEEGAWLAEAGRFEVLVGASAGDIRCRAAFELAADWRQVVG